MKTKLLSLFFIAQSFMAVNAQTFSGKQLVTTADNNVKNFEFEDIDLDGDIDILATSSVNNHVFWYKNLGGETFSAKTLISSNYSSPNMIKVLDIDEDGKKDIVVAEDSDGLSWIKNMGGGYFGTKQGLPYNSDLSSFVIGDVDNDGKKDIVTAQLNSDYMYWLRNTGGGVFVGMTMFYIAPTGTNIYSFEFADLDQDNTSDLIVSTGSTASQTIIQFEYISNAFVQTPVYSSATTPYIYNSFLADVDNDDKMDVVANSSDCNLYWFKNFGGNTYSGLNPIGLASCAYNRVASVGDLDLDGNADLVYKVDSNLRWRENQGSGAFSATLTDISVDVIVGTIDHTTLFDIDADGDLDIFYVTGEEFGWFENNAAQLSAPETSKTAISVYPNPASDMLNIASQNELTSVAVYNMLGQQVLVKALGSNQGSIDVSVLNAGTYFAKVTSGEKSETFKIIKK